MIQASLDLEQTQRGGWMVSPFVYADFESCFKSPLYVLWLSSHLNENIIFAWALLQQNHYH